MNNKKGFTLIELVAVIAILGVLLLIAIPSITAFQRNVEKRQIKEDIRIFKQQAKNLIKTDVGKEPTGGTISVELSEIDQSQLNGKYTSGRVDALGCDYKRVTGVEIVSCSSYKLAILKNGKWTVVEDSTISNPSDPPYHFTKEP